MPAVRARTGQRCVTLHREQRAGGVRSHHLAEPVPSVEPPRSRTAHVVEGVRMHPGLPPRVDLDVETLDGPRDLREERVAPLDDACMTLDGRTTPRVRAHRTEHRELELVSRRAGHPVVHRAQGVDVQRDAAEERAGPVVVNRGWQLDLRLVVHSPVVHAGSHAPLGGAEEVPVQRCDHTGCGLRRVDARPERAGGAHAVCRVVVGRVHTSLGSGTSSLVQRCASTSSVKSRHTMRCPSPGSPSTEMVTSCSRCRCG